MATPAASSALLESVGGSPGSTVHSNNTAQAGVSSIHGASAAKRQAISEILFFASVGDITRCKRIATSFNIQVSDALCCDYDKRTPLHLSCAEGAYSVIEWLLSEGVDINAVDRFQRTPLEEAVRGDHGQVAGLLVEQGAQVLDPDRGLIDLAESHLAKNVRIFDEEEFNPEWEVEPESVVKQDKLGEGEFGVVYRARWNGTAVALKELKDTNDLALGDFRTELNVMQKVHHPNAVQFLGACTKTKPYFILTELMAGGSVLDVFNKSADRLPLLRGLEYAVDCARGMAYLHNRSPQQVIHRDLKPANLMIGGHRVRDARDRKLLWNRTGTVKIADFGLSKTLALQKPHRLPPVGALMDKMHQPEGGSFSYQLTGETGSYRYMAPEVFRHEPYNNKVDVYAFSMICYQLFEGVPPFWQLHPVEAAKMAALQHKRPQWVSELNTVPPQLKTLVERCWNPKSELRPEFVEIIDELEDIAAALPTLGSDRKSNSTCCSVM